MSTRGAVGFHKDGIDKVMYNHSDSYPEWLGRNTLEFIQTHTMENMVAVFPFIKLVDEDTHPTEEDRLACEQWSNLDVSRKSEDDWYCLLREAQGDLEAYTDEGLRYMIDGSSFLADSLFCEWAYIINLDTRKLEIYKGFNYNPEAAGRYAVLHDEPRFSGDKNEFYGVVLIDEISFDEIMLGVVDELVKRINDNAKEDEEE